ncbi:hypothetical protein GCM10023079_25070 [Streptomyces chitinivorans]
MAPQLPQDQRPSGPWITVAPHVVQFNGSSPSAVSRLAARAAGAVTIEGAAVTGHRSPAHGR